MRRRRPLRRRSPMWGQVWRRLPGLRSGPPMRSRMRSRSRSLRRLQLQLLPVVGTLRHLLLASSTFRQTQGHRSRSIEFDPAICCLLAGPPAALRGSGVRHGGRVGVNLIEKRQIEKRELEDGTLASWGTRGF
jgi:hypothetical protein